MTEWWVSQPKHFCKICRVWTGGHRNQILKHEQGIAHIENEAKGIKDARERQKKKDAEEKSVKDQLAEIERKALAAMTGFIAPPTTAATPAVAGHIPNAAEQKRAIIETVEAAKRRRTEGASVGSWTAHVDPNSKCTYYYNATTKESRWEKPPDFVEPATAAAASGGSQSHTVVGCHCDSRHGFYSFGSSGHPGNAADCHTAGCGSAQQCAAAVGDSWTRGSCSAACFGASHRCRSRFAVGSLHRSNDWASLLFQQAHDVFNMGEAHGLRSRPLKTTCTS